jgi:hypothetical protein
MFICPIIPEPQLAYPKVPAILSRKSLNPGKRVMKY